MGGRGGGAGAAAAAVAGRRARRRRQQLLRGRRLSSCSAASVRASRSIWWMRRGRGRCWMGWLGGKMRGRGSSRRGRGSKRGGRGGQRGQGGCRGPQAAAWRGRCKQLLGVTLSNDSRSGWCFGIVEVGCMQPYLDLSHSGLEASLPCPAGFQEDGGAGEAWVSNVQDLSPMPALTKPQGHVSTGLPGKRPGKDLIWLDGVQSQTARSGTSNPVSCKKRGASTLRRQGCMSASTCSSITQLPIKYGHRT